MKTTVIVISFLLYISGMNYSFTTESIVKKTTYSDEERIHNRFYQTNPDSMKFGRLIEETADGARLFSAAEMPASAFLEELKKSFRGKALFIDLWATWCGICIYEMPYSKKLQEEVKDLPVEFIFLCTSNGSNINLWESKVKEMKMPGIHVFVPAKMETDFIKLFFKTEAYPYYIFIDQLGKYIPKAIRTPSSTDRTKLETLLRIKQIP